MKSNLTSPPTVKYFMATARICDPSQEAELSTLTDSKGQGPEWFTALTPQPSLFFWVALL